MTKLTDKQITIIKNQINNIDIIGKVLTQESNLIASYLKKNTIVKHPNWFREKSQLEYIQTALNTVITHFQGRVEKIEEQLPKIKEKK